MKRGHIELWILVAVIVIAIVGLGLTLNPHGKATAVYHECVVDCMPRKMVESKTFVTPSAQEAQALCNQYADEACSPGSSARSIAAKVTGNFAVPQAKDYGGAILGISSPNTRSFSGRAIDRPENKDCYICSCLPQGITASDRVSATKTCFDNCKGEIMSANQGICA